MRTTLRGMRRNAAGVAVLAAVAAGIAAWVWLPWRNPNARTIPTGASFNLVVVQPDDHAYSRAVAAGLEQSGLPAFTRTLGRGTQVVVGPFVDLDEAERAQRRLRRGGYRTRLIVDESIRREAGGDGIPTPGTGVQMLLVSGGGRLSMVMELPAEPRQFSARRLSPGVLEVDIRPSPGAFERQRWKTPAGVGPLDEVLVDTVTVGGQPVLRARLSVSDVAMSNVRRLGRRLYVDLWESNVLESRVVAARQGPPYQDPDASVVGRPLAGRQIDEAGRRDPPYETRIAPALARFHQMEPFVLSSVSAPSPGVLEALDGSLRGLERWIHEIEAPADAASQHAMLVESVRLAREAVDPAFQGDRTARAKEAFALSRRATVTASATATSPSTAEYTKKAT